MTPEPVEPFFNDFRHALRALRVALVKHGFRADNLTVEVEYRAAQALRTVRSMPIAHRDGHQHLDGVQIKEAVR